MTAAPLLRHTAHDFPVDLSFIRLVNEWQNLHPKWRWLLNMSQILRRNKRLGGWQSVPNQTYLRNVDIVMIGNLMISRESSDFQ
jgi:hypothetical protein